MEQQKKIPKFQDAGTIWLTYPGTHDTGFNFSQKIANKALIPKGLELPEWVQNPTTTYIDIAARNGDPLANAIKAKESI